MTKANKRSILKIVALVCVIIVGDYLGAFGELGTILDQLTFMAGHLLIIGAITVWTTSNSNRITHDWIRYYMLMMAGIMVGWVLVRSCKFRIFANGFVSRHLWYAYYVPMILLPLWGFLCSLHMGKREDENIDKRWKSLYIPAVLLMVGILTNDLHELAFNFGGNIGLDYENYDHYTYGPLYYMVAAWMIILSLVTILFLLKKCRISEGRGFIWLPFLVIPVGVGYSMLYSCGIRMGDVTVVFCFLEMILIETIIDSGLILSNKNYEEIFVKSSLNVSILDKTGKTVYKAGSAKEISNEDFASLKEQGYLDKGNGYVTRMKPITGGYAGWVKEPDIIQGVINQLMDVEQELRSNTEMLSEEIKIKRHRIKIDEQLRLYQKIASHTKPQYDKIKSYLKWMENCPEEERGIHLSRIAFLGAFIKRESNLVLLAESNSTIASGELRRCFEETLENLKPFGVDYALNIQDDIILDAKASVACYQVVESVLENIMEQLNLLLITVTKQGEDLFCSLRYEVNGEEFLKNYSFKGKGDVQ